MKFRKSGFIIVFMILISLLYCCFMLSIFTEKISTQQNLLFYHLLTPKPLKQVPRVSSDWFFVSYSDEGSHLQLSEIIFIGIQKSDVQIAVDKLNAYIETYPASREMLSVVAEEKMKSMILKSFITNQMNEKKAIKFADGLFTYSISSGSSERIIPVLSAYRWSPEKNVTPPKLTRTSLSPIPSPAAPTGMAAIA